MDVEVHHIRGSMLNFKMIRCFTFCAFFFQLRRSFQGWTWTIGQISLTSGWVWSFLWALEESESGRSGNNGPLNTCYNRSDPFTSGVTDSKFVWGAISTWPSAPVPNNVFGRTHHNSNNCKRRYCDKRYTGVYLCFVVYIYFSWVLEYKMQKKPLAK